MFLFSEPTLLFSERTSKTGNQHILSGQLVREKSKKWFFPRAGNGLPQKNKKMIKLCYILHIFALTLFLFLLFCPIGGEKDIYAHGWKFFLFSYFVGGLKLNDNQ